MFTFKDHVSGRSHFEYFRDGKLWYKTDTDFEFPVPIEDTNGASFNKEEKSIFFMRWIRKWHNELENEKKLIDNQLLK